MNQNEGQLGAQAQPQGVEVDLDAYIATLTGQRNAALDMVAQQAGMLSRVQKQLADLKAVQPKQGPTLVPPAAE